MSILRIHLQNQIIADNKVFYMYQFSSEVAKMNSTCNMAMCMCMSFRFTFQKEYKI
jgi:hypothetical protein